MKTYLVKNDVNNDLKIKSLVFTKEKILSNYAIGPGKNMGERPK